MVDASHSADPGRLRRQAVGFMALAAALVAGTTLIAKVLGQPLSGGAALHPFQVSAGRFIFGFATVVLVIAARPTLRPQFKQVHWPWHIARSLTGWLGVSAMFAASARMPLADATAISFLNLLVAMVLAIVVLDESAERQKWVAAGLCLVGAAVLLRPGAEAFQIAGLFALAAALFLGVEALFIKRLSDTEPPLQILLINNAIGALASGIALSFVWQIPNAPQWVGLVAIGAVMITAQSAFIQSMKRGQASLSIIVLYTTLVFAALYDFVIFQVVPTPLTIVGAGFIVSGALLLALWPASTPRPQSGSD